MSPGPFLAAPGGGSWLRAAHLAAAEVGLHTFHDEREARARRGGGLEVHLGGGVEVVSGSVGAPVFG